MAKLGDDAISQRVEGLRHSRRCHTDLEEGSGLAAAPRRCVACPSIPQDGGLQYIKVSIYAWSVGCRARSRKELGGDDENRQESKK
jgi:hypothetical protein